jgi:hypothetical protein
MKLHSFLLSAVRFAADTGTSTGPAPSTNETNEPDYMQAAGNRQQDFGKALKEFIRSTSTSMKKARELADMAMDHFKAHGDTVYFQSFTDAISKHASNYVRLAALVAWATTFAPLTFDKGKWTKDKERAITIDWDNDKEVKVLIDEVMVGSTDVSFWDFAPEKTIEKLDAEALLKMIVGKVNSKKLAERVAGNASAEATLALLKSTLTAVKAVNLAEPVSEGQQAA